VESGWRFERTNNIQIAGTHAYITTDKALVIVSIDDPMNPKLVKQIPLHHPHNVAIQFRYAFVVDKEGLKVVDVTKPEEARLVEGAEVKLSHAHDIYVARTYAYVANGKDGIAIINVESPEQPKLDQMYNAEGKLNDVHQVKVAMTNASLYAYVADGHNGLRILQLTDPETSTTYAGFSPRPDPKLIATLRRPVRQLPSPKVSTETAPLTKAAINSLSLADAARAPSTCRSCSACIS
jgi:hypothetical protein